jgi:hypothetical protein
LDELNGEVTVHIPTRLNGTEYWDEEMEKYDQQYNGVEEGKRERGVHVLNLTVDINKHKLEFNTVGIQEEPEAQGVGGESPESKLSNLDIARQDADATIAEGDDGDVSVDVENVGDVDGKFDVTLEIPPKGDTEPAYEETINDFAVDAGATETATFGSITGGLNMGDYDVVVSTEDDDISGDLTVQEDVSGPPIILVDGSTPGPESSALEFDIENVAGEDVIITEFKISTPGNQNSAVSSNVDNIDRDAKKDKGNVPKNRAEIQIRDSDGVLLGYATPDTGSNKQFNTETTYSMTPSPGNGEEATIADGTVASVDMGEFNDGNVDLTYSSTENEADSDVTVAFTLEDGTTVEFYFRVTNVNT